MQIFSRGYRALRKRVFGVIDVFKRMSNSRLSVERLEQFMERIERNRGYFVTYHVRPRLASEVGTRFLGDLTVGKNEVAIMVQGPLLRTGNFTLETFKLYRALFPNARLILSTWEKERGPETEAIERLGAVVIYSPEPPISGYWNINFQIASTQAGIRAAVDGKAKYIVKTRSDQRFYSPGLLEYLLNLLRVFPLDKVDTSSQVARLVCISLGTCKYRAYAVSDMFLFGTAEDVARYWNQPLDSRVHQKQVFTSIRQEVLFRAPEIYFMENFMRSKGRELNFTLEDYWDILRRYFCVVDSEALDLYWPKYQSRNEFRYRDYTSSRTSEMVTFLDWLSLKSGKTPFHSDEKTQDLPFGDKIGART
jgi:hypothetical protein